jgi:hypothetical protein
MTPGSSPRGVSRAWVVAWIGGVGIGVGNGVVREVTYGKRLGEPSAGLLSAIATIVAFAAFFRRLNRRWPLGGSRQSLSFGAVWVALTVCFEFGFGRLVAGKSWRELNAEYDLRRGRPWPLVLAWIALGPEIARRTARRRPG